MCLKSKLMLSVWNRCSVLGSALLLFRGTKTIRVVLPSRSFPRSFWVLRQIHTDSFDGFRWKSFSVTSSRWQKDFWVVKDVTVPAPSTGGAVFLEVVYDLSEASNPPCASSTLPQWQTETQMKRISVFLHLYLLLFSSFFFSADVILSHVKSSEGSEQENDRHGWILTKHWD